MRIIGKFVDLTLEEEYDLASTTFSMLRHDTCYLKGSQYDFLKRKFWFGRACFGTSLGYEKLMGWLDCFEYWERWAAERFYRRPEVLIEGGQKTAQGQFSWNAQDSVVKVKRDIVETWYRAWQDHPIHKYSEFSEWPYPEVRDGAKLLAQQPARIEKAIKGEIARLARIDEEMKQPGKWSCRENAETFVNDFMWTADRFLKPMDRNAWLEKTNEIVARTGLTPYEVAAYVEDFNAPPDYLRLVNDKLYREERDRYLSEQPQRQEEARIREEIYWRNEERLEDEAYWEAMSNP